MLKPANDSADMPIADAAALADYIGQCDDILAEATKGGARPAYLLLPAPSWPFHRAALHHWLDELCRKYGQRIRVDFDPPYGTARRRGLND
jgi:hypothetical protein